MKNKKQYNNIRHAFLLTFFLQEKEHYERKFVNGFWLVKQWNGGSNKWEVAIYTPESIQRADLFQENQKNLGILDRIAKQI